MSLVFTSRNTLWRPESVRVRAKDFRIFSKDKLGRSAKHVTVGGSLAKKATIVISLVEESCESTPEEIKKEIFQELSNGRLKIPWFRKVEKITIA